MAFIREPGTYKVTLTVRDSYLTGDVTETFTVIVNEPPVIGEFDIPDAIYVGESVVLDVNVSIQKTPLIT